MRTKNFDLRRISEIAMKIRGDVGDAYVLGTRREQFRIRTERQGADRIALRIESTQNGEGILIENEMGSKWGQS